MGNSRNHISEVITATKKAFISTSRIYKTVTNIAL